MRVVIPGEEEDRWRDSRVARASVAGLIGAARSLSRPDVEREAAATFSVYVVLLEDARGHPGHSLYVGRTGLPPRERFLNHKRGHKVSRWVRKWGVGLLPTLYEHLNPLESDASVAMEIDLAAALRSAGLHVIQN